MDRQFQRGEGLNGLIEAAYRGRISRRTFFKTLIAAGFGATAASALADNAAQAQSRQATQLANLKNEFDYVIVGAGTAGCVIAHRLSQDSRSTVLVVEGGGTDVGQERISNALMWASNIGSTTDWGNRTLPQTRMNGRVVPFPVGRIVGGGSSINAGVWLRGDKADYDAWAAIAGPEWGFAPILECFKRVERYRGGESPYRGGSGLIATRKCAPAHPVTRGFIESARTQGSPDQFDINAGASMLGAGVLDINVDDDMRRISAAHAYLLPALARPNLTLLSDAPVLRLDIEHGRCRGVVARSPTGERRFAAAKEVILCAGSLHFPKLLMLSGVGPADHLGRIGIPVAVDSPGIGSNMEDHLLLPIYFASKARMPPLTDTGLAGIAYFKSRSSTRGPDIQIFGSQHARGMPNYEPDQGFSIRAGLMKPRSRGTVRLTSADPTAALAIDPNYLAEEADLVAYVDAVEHAIAIGNGKAFDSLRNEQVSLRGASKTQIVEYIRASAHTHFHYVGTCSMGTHKDAPVDEKLRVRGIERLRVADGSVIPEIPCCNTNAPILSLAEKAAELINA